MKNEIIELFNSENISDKVLGIRIMVENDLISEMFYEDDVKNIFDLEIKLREENKDSGTIITAGHIFYIARNNFIARVDMEKAIRRRDVSTLLDQIIYNDDSVDLKQFQ